MTESGNDRPEQVLRASASEDIRKPVDLAYVNLLESDEEGKSLSLWTGFCRLPEV